MSVAEISKRRTFAIISHPDAGKTTITEKLLLFGKVIQTAGVVKGRGGNFAKSDWMAIEQQRGISVNTSVMQFPYKDCVVNLLDTPGHEDFSEDTYRTLTAVDSCLMVIDSAKGVEERTIKLMEVARLRNTPIFTFINKLDRNGLEPFQLLDDIEDVLKIKCAPITWPVGGGQLFKGVYHLLEDKFYLYKTGQGSKITEIEQFQGLDDPNLEKTIGSAQLEQLHLDLELLRGTGYDFDFEQFKQGKVTPVFFGVALGNFGVNHFLDALITWGNSPGARATIGREVQSNEEKFTGFVFKIQANMDKKHRDRIAFMRIVSGQYQKGMKLKHIRIGKEVVISDAITFLAQDRNHLDTAFAGDIIGIHNHGTIQIGDTFTQGEDLKFIGIPSFAPELFRLIRLRDPLARKQLLKGLLQLSEEGSVQLFRPLTNNDLILGAIGMLQFDVVVQRLLAEYNVQAIYEPVNLVTVRWIKCADPQKLAQFKSKHEAFLALDGADNLAYLAPNMVKLQFAMEKEPDIEFLKTREH